MLDDQGIAFNRPARRLPGPALPQASRQGPGVARRPAPAEPELGPDSLPAVFWRRRLTVLACVAAAVAGSGLLLRRAAPQFRSTARVYIAQGPGRILNDGQAAVPQPGNYLATECEVIKSAQVLESVAAAGAGAATRPAATPATAPVAATQPGGGADDPPGVAQAAQALRAGLTVTVDKGVDVISVSYVCGSPEQAARVVKAVVERYAAFHADQTRTNSEELLRGLEKEKAKREAELGEKMATLNEFKRANGMAYAGDTNTNLMANRLASLAAAQADAQLEVVKLRAGSSPRNPGLEAAVLREQQITTYLDGQRRAAAEANSRAVEYGLLDGEVQRMQRLCDQLDTRIKEVSVNSGDVSPSRVVVLEKGRPDYEPVSPRKPQVVGLAAVAGLLAGCGLALLRERSDQRLRTPEEVAAVVRVPVLGAVPRMKGRVGAAARGQQVHLAPTSPAAEAFRTVRTAIYFGTPRGMGRTVLVTSPTPGDGKSTTASNLAAAMAQSGERVLLVDTDFRRPVQHVTFGLPNDRGLSGVLAGRHDAAAAIRPTTVGGLDLLPCGPTPPNPAEILNSQAFLDVLAELAGRYDRVVLDSPPVLAVADARILGAACDVTLLTIRSGKSTRKLTTAARDGLEAVGARLLGIVVNGGPNGRTSYGGYGYYAAPGRVTPGGPSGVAEVPTSVADVMSLADVAAVAAGLAGRPPHPGNAGGSANHNGNGNASGARPAVEPAPQAEPVVGVAAPAAGAAFAWLDAGPRLQGPD